MFNKTYAFQIKTQTFNQIMINLYFKIYYKSAYNFNFIY